MTETSEMAPADLSQTVGLKRDAIGLLGVTMQSITHIAPAIAAIFYTQFVVSLTGLAAPLAYVVGVIVTMMMGITLAQLAKALPSAGGYYTYVSRGIHPRFGFLTSWMYTLYDPTTGGIMYGFFGYILSQALHSYNGIYLPWLWWVCILVAAPFLAWVQHRGIALSAQFMLITGALEMIIVFVLAIWGFARPGPGGFTLQVFDFSRKTSMEGFALAIVFSVQGLTGWEGAGPLAEETSNPRRNVPRAILLSLGLLGAYLVVAYWGQIVGFGPQNLKGLVSSSALPGIALARRFWGAGYVILIFAIFNSVMANGLATANVGTRMWYRMGRTGVLPRALGWTHPKYRTPTVAILLQLAISLACGLGIGVLLNPDRSFLFMVGLVLVMACIWIYISGNIACFMLYWRDRRGEFNVVMHLIFPLVTTAALVYALIESFIPFPSFPYNWTPLVDGLWLALGVVLLIIMKVRGNERWLLEAGKALDEAGTYEESSEPVPQPSGL